MPEVFADTGYWIALLNERDGLHIKARELSERFSTATIVTTEMVLTELLNHASGGWAPNTTSHGRGRTELDGRYKH